jgi:hypothetical protein
MFKNLIIQIMIFLIMINYYELDLMNNLMSIRYRIKNEEVWIFMLKVGIWEEGEVVKSGI